MSIKHVQFALDGVPGLNAGQRLTLVSLGEWANDEGVCWPSHDTIAKRVGVGRRQVIRIIEQLEAMGVVERIERKQYSNKYQIRCDIAVSHLNQAPDVTPIAHVTPKADVTLGTPDVTLGTPDVTSRASRCDIAMSPEPPIEPPKRTTTKNHQDRAAAPKPMPANGPVQELVKLWYERAGGEPVNWGKAMGHGKTLVRANVTGGELWELYDWLASNPWNKASWSFDLGTAVALLEQFRQAKRLPKRNGRASPAESNLERNLRNLWGDRSEPEPEFEDVFETKGFVRQ